VYGGHDDTNAQEVSMKYLGSIKVSLLKERQEYRELFSPLSESEYEDLRQSIRKGGIVNDLIVEKGANGYIVLSGHHRKAVAEELGIEEVPCSLAETPEEIVEALFDNASRRQMTEVERKAKIQEKEEAQDRFFEEHLIPEIYALYKEGKIDRKSIDEFLDADPEVQRSILQCLSIEREVVPDALLEKHEREMASVTRRYNEDIDAVRKELAAAKAEKKKAQETLLENGKELEKIRERAEDTLARYKKSKEQITKEVEKEIEKEIEDLKKERETREAAMKAKQDEIEALNGKIKSLDATIYGYDAQVALWKHEVARMSETYNKSVAYYSNPALIEIQLQVISEFVESLVRFSECHKWDAEASKTVEKYRKSIGDLLEKLAGQVKAHQKEVVSLEESEKAIAAQGGVEVQDGQKAS
jgi:ParB-like chromosome segregation protein Spo0J